MKNTVFCFLFDQNYKVNTESYIQKVNCGFLCQNTDNLTKFWVYVTNNCKKKRPVHTKCIEFVSPLTLWDPAGLALSRCRSPCRKPPPWRTGSRSGLWRLSRTASSRVWGSGPAALRCPSWRRISPSLRDKHKTFNTGDVSQPADVLENETPAWETRPEETESALCLLRKAYD